MVKPIAAVLVVACENNLQPLSNLSPNAPPLTTPGFKKNGKFAMMVFILLTISPAVACLFATISKFLSK